MSPDLGDVAQILSDLTSDALGRVVSAFVVGDYDAALVWQTRATGFTRLSWECVKLARTHSRNCVADS